MTLDFFLGQLRLIMVAAIAFAAGKGWLSTDTTTFLGAILAPVGMLFGPWAWSIYTNINQKLVPRNAIAISPDNVVNAQTAAADGKAFIRVDQGPTVTADVVAKVLIAAFALSLFLAASPAAAQAPRKLTGNLVQDLNIGAKPDADTSADKATGSFGQQVRKITKDLVDKAIADVTAARDDADKHNDLISKPCWEANLKLLQGLPSQWETPPADIGIALGIQIQRDLLNSITGNDVTSLKVACAALWGDQLKIVANVGALLGLRIATGGLF